MYLPELNEETDPATLRALIGAHPLGTLVTLADGELVADHIPFLLDADRGQWGTLVGHVARANPVWRSLPQSADSLAIFQGAQTYVSPSWYPSKREHGKVVPTWNCAVVHAHGKAVAIEDRDWLRQLVTRLTNTHEAASAAPWKVTDAPPEYVETMLRAIVGIEIPITKLVGKWKVSQNRPEADKLGVVAGLQAKGGDESAAMAALVRRKVAVPGNN